MPQNKYRKASLIFKFLMASCFSWTAFAQNTSTYFSSLTPWQQELLTPSPSWITQQWSSHDRAGGNDDAHPAWLYIENDGPVVWRVLAEGYGEGRLTRLWMTGPRPTISPIGDISIEIDGREILRGPAISLFTGELAAQIGQHVYPLHWPLVADDMRSSGGYFLQAPFGFRRHFKVKISGHPQFYQVNASFGVGAARVPDLESWSEELAESHLPQAPRWAEELAHEVYQEVRQGQSLTLRGPGILSALSIEKNSNQDETYLEYWRKPSRGSLTMKWRTRLSAFFASSCDTSMSLIFASRQTAAQEAETVTDTHGRCIFSSRLPIPLRKGDEFRISTSESLRVRTRLIPIPRDESTAELPILDIQARTAESASFSRRQIIPIYESAAHQDSVTKLIHTQIQVSGPSRLYLEGDEMVRIDGLAAPFILGTGTEDYFNGGYYFYGRHTNPLSGLVRFLPNWATRNYQLSMYRHHVLDPIISRGLLRFGIESGREGDFVGARYETSAMAYVWENEAAETPAQVASRQLTIPLNSLPNLTIPREPLDPSAPTATPVITTASFSSSHDAESASPNFVRSYRYHQAHFSIPLSITAGTRLISIDRQVDANLCRQYAKVTLNFPPATGLGPIQGYWNFSHCNNIRRHGEDLILLQIPRALESATTATLTIDARHSLVPWSESEYRVRYLR